MRNLDWYLDTARERQRLASDHELSLWLGRSKGQVAQWRTKRCWPTGKVMVKLAAACDVPSGIALAELGTWKEPEVAEWRDLVASLSRHVSAVLIAIILGNTMPPGASPAAARTPLEQPAAASPEHIHYATFISRLRRRAAQLKQALRNAFLNPRHNSGHTGAAVGCVV